MRSVFGRRHNDVEGDWPSPSFATNTPEAKQVRQAAVKLSSWLENESNHAVFESFATAVYEDINSLFSSGSGRGRPPLSAN